ncbi:MAG: glycogen synthase [bacterium]|nr:glycogen synthase [bacterium]
MNILFTSAEVDPFAKVGGLADVVGSLPKALRQHGIDARVLMPDYGFIDKAGYGARHLLTFELYRRTGITACELFTLDYEGVPIYFLRGAPYFGTEAGVYQGWDADVPRFVFFSQAALAACDALRTQHGWMPDVIHAHDWHTGLIPFLTARARIENPAWAGVGTMYTIHNMAYQGDYVGGWMFEFGIPERDQPELIRFGKSDNLMGIALAYTDVITTVSPRYSVEIQYPYQGYGLDQLLRTRMLDLYGILNGIDTDHWNPATDPHLAAPFDADTFAEGRGANKQQLQQDAGLPIRPDTPLIGIVSRLVSQKGFDLALQPLRDLLGSADVQLVVLGSGESDIQGSLWQIGEDFRDKARVYIGYNAALAQRIYGGCDLFLMPSRYEPCGVGQMLAMRYGALPLVRVTGGLADTVTNYDNHDGTTGTGFVFEWETPEAVFGTLQWALATYRDRPDAWRRMQERAMRTDFSWKKSAGDYIALYEQILKRRTNAS